MYCVGIFNILRLTYVCENWRFTLNIFLIKFKKYKNKSVKIEDFLWKLCTYFEDKESIFKLNKGVNRFSDMNDDLHGIFLKLVKKYREKRFKIEECFVK